MITRRETYFKIFFISCFLCLCALPGQAQKSKPTLTILEYNVEQAATCMNEAGFIVHFTKCEISNLKDRYIRMAFAVKQNGKWLSGTRLYGGNEELVLHQVAVFTWQSESLWFCYPYNQLEKAGGDLSKPFHGYLIVTEAGTKKGKDFTMAEIEISMDNEDLVLDNQAAVVPDSLPPDNMIAYNEIEVEYTEALGDRIEIKNNILYYSRQTGFKGDTQGPSANFSPTRSTSQKELAEADLKALLGVFYANGWYDLKEGYGANAKDRYYPETIRLKDQSGDKIVVYRSNPNAKETKPGAFTAIVNAIIELKDKYF